MAARSPSNGRTVQAHLTVHDAAAALDFYRRAFDAEELFRLTEPSGRIGHAELRIGDTVLMLNDEYPDFGARSPASIGGSPVSFHIRVADADRAVAHAVAAGATLVRPVQDQFYGDRVGMVACPFGYRWSLAAAAEVLTQDELQRRWAEMCAGGSP